MLRPVFFILKWAALLASGLVTVQIIRQAPAILGMISLKALWPYLTVCGGFLVAYALVIRRFVGSLEILQHELTHLFFGLLFLKVPTRIMAVDEPHTGLRGGEVQMVGGSGGGNFIIGLSPYWFPLLAVIFWGIFQVVDVSHAHLAKQAVAISYTWFMLMNFKQLHFGQTDLRSQGLFYSCILLFNLNLLVLLLVVFFLQDQAGGFLSLLKAEIPDWNNLLPSLPELPDFDFSFGLGAGGQEPPAPDPGPGGAEGGNPQLLENGGGGQEGSPRDDGSYLYF